VSEQGASPPPPPPPSPPGYGTAPGQPGAAGSGTGALGIGGWIFAVIALLVLLVGLAAVAVHLTQRDGDGFYTSPLTEVRSPGHAVFATGLLLDSNSGAAAARAVLGDVRISAQGADDRPVFVGIARQSDIDVYLAGSARSKVREMDGSHVTYRERGGSKQPGAPGDERFWRSSASGAGRQTLNWKAEKGDFSIVVMNADASKPVRASVTVGAKAPAVLWIGIGLAVLALVLAGVGAAMIVSDRRKRRRDAASAGAGA
jgi:hypothetical protein